MRPIKLDIDPADEDTDGFADGVTASAGTAFTLAANDASDELAHKVVITPSGSVTGNYTLTGTDADGKTQTETLATDTTNAVTSAKYYKTLTEVLSPSGIGSETVDIGWADEVASQTIPLDSYVSTPASVQIDVTGTLDLTVQETLDDIYDPDVITDQDAVFWSDDGNFVNESADVIDVLGITGIRAIRFILNSYSSGAEFQAYITIPRM